MPTLGPRRLIPPRARRSAGRAAPSRLPPASGQILQRVPLRIVSIRRAALRHGSPAAHENDTLGASRAAEPSSSSKYSRSLKLNAAATMFAGNVERPVSYRATQSL